ncbi:hypothetical protein ACFC96_32145 [Streptomyces sp. NPDC055955]
MPDPPQVHRNPGAGPGVVQVGSAHPTQLQLMTNAEAAGRLTATAGR